jgi:cytochrome P450
MLARDGTQINWHEKAVMRSALRWEDLREVRKLVAEVARESLRGVSGKVELVSRVGRLAPLRVVQRYFGFVGPDDATMLRWSKATQWDMFRNLTNDPAVHAANVQAGQEMRAYLWHFLGELWSRPPERHPDLPVHRLARLTQAGLAGMDASRVVANVAGLLVGAVETTAQAIVQAVEQILLRPDVTARAVAAAKAGDNDTFDLIVWEALRFNPITTIVLRYAERESVLCPGTADATTVPAGAAVAACIGSAMFDEAAVTAPDEFRTDRPADAYLHFGHGHHECLGRHVGAVAIPEAVRQVLLLPGLAPLPGPEGKIDFKDGPFPEQYFVGTSPSPA